MNDLVKIRRAIISTYDKKNLAGFAETLVKINKDIELYSSSGTAAELQKTVLKNLREISEYTGFPEMPSGLVKTLHPKIHAGILAEVGNEQQSAYLQMHNIKEFDLIVVNLYPFSKASASGTYEDARKNIDIGGVSLIEAASKNFLRVAVVVDPADYDLITAGMKKNNGSIDLKTRIVLAKKAFSYLANYLAGISSYYSALPDDKIQAFYGVKANDWEKRLQERLRKDN
jgi:phosphoribosylaminoimidazolecarboxamide formyltransferase / IMP cyclohydrolase